MIETTLQDCVLDTCAKNNIELAVAQAVEFAIQACYVNGFDCPAPEITPGLCSHMLQFLHYFM